MYAKITNEETKECAVGVGTNTEFYESIGMAEMEVEQAWNGSWYVKGYAPEKPEAITNEERVAELKQKLADSDYAVIKIAEATGEEAEVLREKYAQVIADRKAWREEINQLENRIEE